MTAAITAAVIAAAAGAVVANDSSRKQKHALEDQAREAAAIEAKRLAIPVADSAAIDAAKRRDRIRRSLASGRTSTVLSEQLG